MSALVLHISALVLHISTPVVPSPRCARVFPVFPPSPCSVALMVLYFSRMLLRELVVLTTVCFLRACGIPSTFPAGWL